MYIRPSKKRRTRPVRILVLLLIDAVGIYILVFRRDLLQPIRFGPSPTPTPTAAQIIDEAHELYLQGAIDDAVARYGLAAELDPQDPEPYVWWAFLLTLRQHTAAAVERAEQAVAVAPESAKARAALCMALDWDAGKGDAEKLQKALKECLTARELDPYLAEAHAYLAEVYADLGRISEAAESAGRAVTLDDNSVFAHRDLGYTLEKRKKYKEAIAEYQRASQLHPRLAQPWLDQGRVQMARGRTKEALEAFEKATVVDPGSAHAGDSYGCALFQQGDYAQAAAVLKKATEADPTYAPAFGHLGLTYYVLRNYEDAVLAYEKAIELGTTENEYFYELGLAYAYLDRCDEGRPWLLRALEADPSASPAQEGLRLCPETPKP